MDKLQEVCKEYNIEINVKKTKVMVISKRENVPCVIKVNGTQLEQVKQYKYLGGLTTEDGRCEKEVKMRTLQWPRKLFGNIKNCLGEI